MRTGFTEGDVATAHEMGIALTADSLQPEPSEFCDPDGMDEYLYSRPSLTEPRSDEYLYREMSAQEIRRELGLL